MRIFLIQLLACTVLLSGCERPQDSEQIPVSIQLDWFAGGEHAYLYHGVQSGLFESRGYDVTIESGRGSSLAAQLLGGGRVNAALISPDALLASREGGSDIVSLGVIYDETPVTIYALRSTGIEELHDLYGHRLGVLPSSNTYIQYQGVARARSLDRDQIEEVAVDGAIAPQLLIQGEIDALTHHTNLAPVQARLLGYDVDEILLRELGLEMYGMTLAVRDSDVEMMIEFRNAVAEALRQTVSDPERSLTAFLEAAQPADPEYERAKLLRFLQLVCPQGECREGLQQSHDRWAETGDTLVELGVIENLDPVTGAYRDN